MQNCRFSPAQATPISASRGTIPQHMDKTMAYTTHPASTTFGAALSTLSNAIGSVSDAELAKMGIKRHEIARYVFRDLFWS